MRLRTSTLRFAPLAFLFAACAGSSPPAQNRAAATHERESHSATHDSSAEENQEASEERAEVPTELAEMLQPRTCQPTLIKATHFRELRDSKGQKHRAFVISPGEELCLVGSPGSEGALADLELSEDPVPLAHAKGRLISVELRTLEMGSVLVVKNHYRSTLQFRGSIALPHQLDMVSTSVCPVMPGRFSVEHWPDTLSSLLLTDFSLHDPSEKLGCE
ncbi:MAG: hypothetical protein ACOY0T_34425 [Myxococcota bacterium]